MRILQHRRTAAETVDTILSELTPAHRSSTQVAEHCRCSTRTVRSWRLDHDELAVPREPARTRLAELVELWLGVGARASLQGAWTALLDDADPALVTGDAAAEARAGLDTDHRPLTRDQRRLVAAQARLVLEQAYAHLPFKRARHAVDPVQRLRLLEYRLSATDTVEASDVGFHREMIDIFTTARDLHTSYVAPKRYQKAVLTLPFMVEEFFEPRPDGDQHPIYIASKVEADHGANPAFREGVQITHWNAVPIRRAIQVLASKQAAGNPPAAFARALDALTLRPLLSSMVPDEEWIDVSFLAEDTSAATARFEWTPVDAPAELLTDDGLHLAVPLGIDAQTDAVTAVRKERYGRRNALWSADAERSGRLPEPIALSDHHIETHMPWFFRAHATRDGRLGYVRIFKFKTRNARAFADEFGRLCSELPTAGLIVDIRGNPGGNIQAAEASLQVLSADPIRPCRAQFTTSPLLLEICRNNPTASRRGPALGPWIDSLAQAVSTASAYSQGYPLTPPELFDQITHRYPGPVVLIVDALTYSAGDMFAAGFIDHGIGKVLGTGDNTGAGGANVWRHSDLLRLAPEDSGLERLPAGIDLRVAVRRTTRVGAHEGEILEDLGIELDARHHMTRRDVLEGNRDLIAAAAALLS